MNRECPQDAAADSRLSQGVPVDLTPTWRDDQEFIRAFQRSLALKASFVVLLVGVVVAFISIQPLYNQLKSKQLEGLRQGALTREKTVSEYLSKAKETAVLVTTRTQMRRELEQLNRGELTTQEYVDLSRPRLEDAIFRSDYLVAVSRFDDRQKFLMDAGIEIPQRYYFFPRESDGHVVIRGPFFIGGQMLLVVGASIRDRDGLVVGSDVVLIATDSLMDVVTDTRNLGRSGQVILGRQVGGKPKKFFASDIANGDTHQADTSDNEELIDEALMLATTRPFGETWLSSLSEHACVSMRFEDVGWTLIVLMSETELHEPLRRQLFLLAGIIGAFMVLGVLAAIWALRPLSRMALKRSEEISNQLAVTKQALLDRLKAEQELANERERLDVTLRSLNDAVIATDKKARITMLNRVAEVLLEVKFEDVRGAEFAEIIPIQSVGATQSEDFAAQVLCKMEPFTAGEAYFIRTPSGQTRRIQVSGAPIVDDAGVGQGAVLVIADKTESYALEKQLQQSQKLEAVGQLTGGIAHDFNNILTAVLGHGEIVLDGMPETDVHRRSIESMQHAAQRAATLTKQLLAFSSRQVLATAPVNLIKLLRGLVGMLHRLIGDNIDLDLSESMDTAVIEADSGQIEQVVVNLVVNARDAMIEGGNIRITVTPLSDADKRKRRGLDLEHRDYCAIRVTDTGTGMPQEIIDQVFDPFFTTKPIGEGTGLGLSTVLGIVKQHGGIVSIESRVNIGTTFELILPLSKENVVEDIDNDPVGMTEGEGTILVVDDDSFIRELLIQVLSGVGYEVLDAGNGVAALTVAEAHRGRIDLLVSDVAMPVMDGPTLYKSLSRKWPDLQVLFISGYTYDLHPGDERGRAEGKAHFLSKPVIPSVLTAKISALLQSRRPE